MTELTERLRTILIERFGVPTDDVTPESTFEDMAVDSLIIVELALILRREYGLQLEDWDLTPEMTVPQAAEFLAKKGAVSA
jgi:acyl carrier protein